MMDILVAASLIEDSEAVAVSITELEVDLVIGKELLCECTVVGLAMELSLLPSGSFAPLEIDGDVEVIVEDEAIESSRFLKGCPSNGAVDTN